MKLIQIYCEDGAEYGLFKYDLEDADSVTEIVKDCHRQAEIAIMEILSDEEESVDDIFENYLSENGIHRVFIEEEIYLPQLS